MSDFKYSPRYSLSKNRPYWLAQCDVATAERAIDAVRYIALVDADHAPKAHGEGFARSDLRLGQNLTMQFKDRALRE